MGPCGLQQWSRAELPAPNLLSDVRQVLCEHYHGVPLSRLYIHIWHAQVPYIRISCEFYPFPDVEKSIFHWPSSLHFPPPSLSQWDFFHCFSNKVHGPVSKIPLITSLIGTPVWLIVKTARYLTLTSGGTVYTFSLGTFRTPLLADLACGNSLNGRSEQLQ